MSVEVGESEKKKPETVEFYNKIKCGVYVADQMFRQYPVKAGARRWLIAVFYNILDLAGINAFVLYKKRTGDNVSRRGFLFSLDAELREDYIVERSSKNSTIARPHSLSIAHKKPKPRTIAANFTQNKTSKLCFKCNKTVCGKCTATKLSE